MKCPNCSSRISTWAVISVSPQVDGPPKVTCQNCNSVFKVKGIYACVLAPLILLTFFPYHLFPSSQILETLVLGCVLSLLYWASFLMFVKLERGEQTGEHHSEPIQK